MFHTCLLSLVYSTNTRKYLWEFGTGGEHPLRADIGINKFEEAKVELDKKLKNRMNLAEGRIATFPGDIRVSTSTNAGQVFPESWMSLPQTDRRIPFSIPLDLKRTINWHQVRIAQLRYA